MVRQIVIEKNKALEMQVLREEVKKAQINATLDSVSNKLIGIFAEPNITTKEQIHDKKVRKKTSRITREFEICEDSQSKC